MKTENKVPAHGGGLAGVVGELFGGRRKYEVLRWWTIENDRGKRHVVQASTPGGVVFLVAPGHLTNPCGAVDFLVLGEAGKTRLAEQQIEVVWPGSDRWAKLDKMLGSTP